MSKIVVFYIFIYLFFFSNSFINAQNNDSENKNYEKIININGKKYYIHKVKQGESLYSISKIYNVEVKIIKQENPDINDDLKLNEELKIPVNKKEKNKLDKSDEFLYYVIEKGESVWSLSKKYNVDEKTILKYNPGADKGLRAGDKIKIPNPYFISKSNKINKKDNENKKIKQSNTSEDNTKDVTNNDKEKIIEDNSIDTAKYILYKVPKRQTMFNIAKKFNVEIEEIHRLNPEISQNGLKSGMVIKIPKVKTITYVTEEPNIQHKHGVKNKIDTVPEINNTDIDKNNNCANFNYNNNPFTIRLALVLPFYNDAIAFEKDEEDNQDNEDNNVKINASPKPFIEFYEGFLLAVDSLKNQGLNIDLSVYDIHNDSNDVNKLLQKKEIKLMDLIIGPVFYPYISTFANFARNNKILFVSPLSSNNDFLENNPYCFQINPSNNTQIEQCAVYFASLKSKNIIVVHNGTEAEMEIIKTFKNKLLKTYYENNHSNNLSFKEVLYTKSGINGVEDAFSKTDDNIVILPSSNQVFILDLVTSLNSLLKSYKISILGFPSWRKFENNLELEYVHNLEMNIFTPYFVDYKDTIIKDFILKYRNNFKSEPTKYSFCGYDICYYFLSAFKKYGKNFRQCIPDYNIKLMQSDFYFKKINKYSGYENNSVFILKYDKEFNVTKLNTITDKPERQVIQ